MIDKRIQLDVFEDNNGTFTDHSVNAVDFVRDTFEVTLATGTDYLYVGFYKPVSALYAEISTVNTNAATMTVESWDGTAWTAVEHRDETKGLTRSGFVTWTRQNVVEEDDRATVNSVKQEWVRFSFDVTTSATTFAGLNLVFADDESLKVEFPQITDPRILTSGFSSNIVHHVAARDMIVQDLRTRGYIKYDSDNVRENMTQWDLLDVYEIKEAAKYAALAKIFFILSDDVEDNWWHKHKEYDEKYQRTMQMARLTFDADDDGDPEDTLEKLDAFKSIRFTR